MCSKHNKKNIALQLKMKGHFKNFYSLLIFALQLHSIKKQNSILKLMVVRIKAVTISKVINKKLKRYDRKSDIT